MNRISTLRAALAALSMVAFSGAALAQSPAKSEPKIDAALAKQAGESADRRVGRTQPWDAVYFVRNQLKTGLLIRSW